ncbi:hypothetical protein P4T43_19480 [Bacillus paranthracis]|jgi:hypothetical protein|uniref:hypothetical protein n=1 Tax=Bacillaceae TaxID=186817 RepID=UPI000507F72E|nr:MULTISPECIES: hypothetical protein [Bacillaceae]KFL86305.1 hypothetical protein DJ51_5664 [Bacillus cereus]MRA63886.1 hypothetical protein [Bacillus thuringiensis]MDX5947718.1 hypothetical protein [Bacillus cereus group sp. BfR-BA-00431]MEC2092468.1 hypothetical protein [Bacillus paranthracis]MEC2127268.1 hypothetical protein [Bacillus paranthracis]
MKRISNKELREISKKYRERAKDPKSAFIKYEGPEQLYDLIMKHKKEQKWKFKDKK